MKVGISEAARLAGISRQHFYTHYINSGKISIDRSNASKPVIDVSELLRVFPSMELHDKVVSSDGHDITLELTRKVSDLDRELTVIRQQLKDSQEREKWLQGTVDKLTDTMRLLEHRPTDEPKKKRWWQW